jgi:serine/threonine protein phosphatase PrpC
VPNATPDSVLDGARLANLTVRAASLRGDDHRHAGETRQDSIGLWVFDPPSWLETDVPVLLACVADGVGSHRLSHLGSAKACSLLRQSVEANLNDLVGTDRGHTERNCRQVIRDVATGLRALAADLSLEPKQVSTTLTACLVVTERKADEGALARAVLFNVGDSVSYLLRERRWLTIPDRGEGDGDGMIDTHTDALPTARLDRTQFTMCTLYKDDVLMLCTDGLGGPLKRNTEVSEQLADWWTGTVPALPEFYWQMSFRAQTYGDDRSAVCIWLHGDG